LQLPLTISILSPSPEDLQTPLTFAYLLPDEVQTDIKAKTLEVYNKGKQAGSSASSSTRPAARSDKAKSAEATAALAEVSDMFK